MSVSRLNLVSRMTFRYFTELAYVNFFPHNFEGSMALDLYFLVKIMAVVLDELTIRPLFLH